MAFCCLTSIFFLHCYKPLSPRLGMGFGSSLGLVLGLAATRQLPSRKIVPRLGLRFGLGLVLGLAGAIFLGGNCHRTSITPLKSFLISS